MSAIFTSFVIWALVSLQTLPSTCSAHACCSDPCENGGKCSLTYGGYFCTCLKDFVGTHCEAKRTCRMQYIGYRDRVDKADIHLDGRSASSCLDFCLKDARCVTAVRSYDQLSRTYTCNLYHDADKSFHVNGTSKQMYWKSCNNYPWIAESCDVAHLSPCKNGGTCKMSTTGLRCHCRAGFVGKYCEHAEDMTRCTTNSTRNRFRTGQIYLRYTRVSTVLYCINKCKADQRCREALYYYSSSLASRWCRLYNDSTLYGGSSYNTNTRYYLIRKTCALNRDDGDSCASNPCKNCGTCRDHHRSFECICHGGFGGKLCEIERGPVSPPPSTIPQQPSPSCKPAQDSFRGDEGNTDDDNGKVPLVALVGGIAGAILCSVFLTLLVVFLLHRSRSAHRRRPEVLQGEQPPGISNPAYAHGEEAAGASRAPQAPPVYYPPQGPGVGGAEAPAPTMSPPNYYEKLSFGQ